MLTEILLPKSELAHVVHGYFILSTTQDATCCPKKFRFLSDGCPELIFHFAQPPQKALPRSPTNTASVFLTGLFARHIDVDLANPSQTLFVKFHPWVQGALLGDAATQACGQGLDIQDIFRPWEHDFRDRMHTAADPCAAILLVEEWLSQRLNAFETDRQVMQAVVLLSRSRGNIAIQTLEEKVNLGIRRLEQKFTEQVGVRMKYFARSVRFRHTAEAIHLQQNTRLADIGYDHGFFDQAHFIREFRHFADMTPATYARAIKGKSSIYELEVTEITA